MQWIKASEIELGVFIGLVPLKVYQGDGFYFSVGSYSPNDKTWYCNLTRKLIPSKDIEYLDESEPNQDILWDDVRSIVCEDLCEEYPSESSWKAIRKLYTITRK